MRAVLAGTGGRLPFALGIGALIAMMVAQPWVDHGVARFVFWPALGALSAATLVAMVRRLHAMGHSGAWALLSAVPILGIGLVLWMLVGARGGADRPPAARYAVGLVLIACAGLLVASRALWRPYSIPAAAMEPAVHSGDWLIASRMPEIRRGAVLVYRDPARGQDVIHRLIGLPGDEVQMIGGRLHLNGQAVALSPAAGAGQGAACAPDAAPPCPPAQWIETLPDGPSYAVLDTGGDALDDTPPLTVPKGQAFFLGDNRDAALDSRVPAAAGGPGFVPLEAIHSQARRVAFNMSDPGRLWVPVP